jgi:hypothetical protein
VVAAVALGVQPAKAREVLLMEVKICVDGDNAFHTGWLARFLAMPKEHPSAQSLKAEYVAAFNEGWEMCDETGNPSALYNAFERMKSLGQASVEWGKVQ